MQTLHYHVVFVTDTANFQGHMRECYHESCDDISHVTSDMITFLARTTDSVVKVATNMTNEKCQMKKVGMAIVVIILHVNRINMVEIHPALPQTDGAETNFLKFCLWLDFGSKGRWFYTQSLPCVFISKKLYPTFSLSTQVYKKGAGNILLGVILRWTSIPSGGRVAILSVASCCRNRVKLRFVWASLAREQLDLCPFIGRFHDSDKFDEFRLESCIFDIYELYVDTLCKFGGEFGDRDEKLLLLYTYNRTPGT